MELVDIYCKENNLILDEEISHIGSAFSGANFKPGTALWEFLERVNSGHIERGSYLLVESLDRLSRDHVFSAYNIFSRIIDSGIVLVTLLDNRSYSVERIKKDWSELIISIAVMSRAREESQRKSERLRATWVNKRRSTKVLTEKGPSWLRFNPPQGDTAGHWQHLPEKVEVLRQIYLELASGVGCDRIARRLNSTAGGKQPAPTLSRAKAWHSGTVYKLIGNRAALGHYQPHRLEKFAAPDGTVKHRRVPDGPERLGYYGPPIVDEAIWTKALVNSANKRLATPNNSGGRKGTIKSNLFTEVAICGHCSSRMNYRDPGPRSKPVLRCSGNRMGSCEAKTRILYEPLETAVLKAAVDIRFNDKLRNEEEDKLRQTVDELKSNLISINESKKRIIRRLGEQDDEQVTEILGELDSKAKPLRSRLDKFEHELLSLRSQGNNHEIKNAFNTMNASLSAAKSNEEKFLIRSRVANMLNDLISYVVCFSDGYISVLTKASAYWRLEHFTEHRLWRDDTTAFELIPDGNAYRVLQAGTLAMSPEDLSADAPPWRSAIVRTENCILPKI